MKKCLKKSKKSYFRAILPKFGQKWIFLEKKGLCQFLNIPIIFHRAKNQEKSDEPLLRKTPNWQTDRDNGGFIGPSVWRGSKKARVTIIF